MQTIIILREEFICLLILSFLFFNDLIYRRERGRNHFLRLCAFALGHVFFDMVTVFTVNHRTIVAETVNHGSHILFYLFGTLFGAEFLRYVFGLIRPGWETPEVARRIKRGYWGFSMLYIAIFWMIPIRYTQGDGTAYSDGPAAAAAFAIPLLFFGVTTALLIMKRRQLDRRVVAALLPMLAVMYLAEAAEIWQTEILITGGCVTLVTVGVYFSLENPLLFHALKQAEAAERAKSFFLATMSHEIRTPLNAVIGFAELLQDNRLTPEVRKIYLHDISTAGNALLALINDVLDLSKLEAGQMDFVAAETDFPALTREVMAIFRSRLAERQLDGRIELAPMPRLMLDKLRMRQILFNLIGNAVKFTDRGSVTVSGEFIPGAERRGTLRFAVADTGCGVPPEDREAIFQPFVQSTARRGTQVANSGTGLGLAIIRRMLRCINGEISLESTPGRGSVFTVELHEVRLADASPSAAEAPAVRNAGAADTIGRVLLVDDVPMNLRVMRAMCESGGLAGVVTAQSGAEALEALECAPFDLVLTDLWMPGMSGAELARRIRADRRWDRTRILAVTADAEALTNFDPALFSGVLLKPVTMAKIADAIARPANSPAENR